MDTFTITIITASVNRQPLARYSRGDGSSYLTSPSLRELQHGARDRQARAIGRTLDSLAPYHGPVPAEGYAARWLDDHGWVAVTQTSSGAAMASLPDLGPAVDHPVFAEREGEGDAPFVVGGNRSTRAARLCVEPIALDGAGIYFHTGGLSTFRDGGSWLVREATLVWDVERNAPAFSWRTIGARRLDVKVACAVEWHDDPTRERVGDGRPLVISQREPVVRYADGRVQRIRLAAVGGSLDAMMLVLADEAPEHMTKRERELLDA